MESAEDQPQSPRLVLGGFNAHGHFYYYIASWTPTHNNYDTSFYTADTDAPTVTSACRHVSAFGGGHFLLVISEVTLTLSPAFFHSLEMSSASAVGEFIAGSSHKVISYRSLPTYLSADYM
jgi:hypothetical protein